jgi:hypothetical protein
MRKEAEPEECQKKWPHHGHDQQEVASSSEKAGDEEPRVELLSHFNIKWSFERPPNTS